MRMKTNTNQTDSTDLSCKELVKFYFYASIADVYHINLPALRRQICQKFQLTDQQLSDMIAERSEKWSQQIEKAENLIRDSYYTDQFIRNLDKKGCTWKISKSNVRDLMACYLALVLQNVSALTFANHTKKKDIILLLNLLEDDEQLHRFEKQLTRPVRKAANGDLAPNSYEYLLYILAYIRILTWYYLDFICGHEGSMELDRQIICNLKSWNTEEIENFLALHPQACSSSLPSPDHIVQPVISL